MTILDFTIFMFALYTLTLGSLALVRWLAARHTKGD